MSWEVDFGGMKQGYFKRDIIKKPQQVQKLVKYFNNQDVYKGCYYRDQDLLYGYFYLDFDCDLESEFEIMKEETIVVYKQIQEEFCLSHDMMQLFFSGAKGFHLLIAPFNLGLGPCKNLNEIYKNMALYYKKISPHIDTKIYDTRRVLRMPNSINSKTGFYKIPLTYDELILSDYKKICELAKEPKALKNHRYVSFKQYVANENMYLKITNLIKKEIEVQRKAQATAFDRSLLDKDVIFPCIERMLNDVHQEGERNKKLIILASHLLQKEVSLEDTYNFLLDWQSAHFDPPLEQSEVLTTVKSAYNQLQHGRRYGCQAILSIDYCDFQCKYTNREE